MLNYTFINYLEDKGYYFDKQAIENYLLSLKVKPFIILAGTSGTGKTELARLFAKYVMLYNNEYYVIKVSTLKRSFSIGKHDNQVGWGVYKEYLDVALPIDEINGKYEVEIGGITTTANLSLVIQLYYDYKNEDIRRYFEKLYNKELLIKEEEKKYKLKHDQQMVYLGVSYESLKKIISEDFLTEKDIVLYPSLTKSVVEGKEKMVPVDIFEYMPFTTRTNCIITTSGFFSNAHWEIKLRMRNYTNAEISKHLKKLYDDHENNFELKIKGFEHKFEDFKLFNYDLLDHRKNYEVLPVGNDWNDGSHIIGFYNAIKNDYYRTPVNEMIKQIEKDPNNPYFLILDEMNLAPIERYFSDFLSAIESGDEILLYGSENETLKIPKNLFIIGSVNSDGDSYKVSPKVLDRANTIELDAVSASDYMLKPREQIFKGNVSYLQSPLLDCDISLLNIRDLEEILSTILYEGNDLWSILSTELGEFQKTLTDSNFGFSYRAINEILRFMVVAWRYENSPKDWPNWKRYFDAQVKQKILPKLQGSEKELGDLLMNLFILCLEDPKRDIPLEEFEVNKKDCKYCTSALKLQKMLKELSNQNYVSFIK